MSSFLRCRHFIANAAALSFVFANAGTLLSQNTPPAKPAVEGKDGWDHIDQRLIFLTVELSTVESSLTSTNKSLKANGYKLADLTFAAERAQEKNNQMDRQGGGPVPWAQFYGQTAKDFFYHPTDDSTVHMNPAPVDQRPPQFDFIYHANEENRVKAEAAAAAVGSKIDDLLAHRKTLEAEQMSLWCKIEFRGIASRELSNQPLYRFNPVTAGSGGPAKQRVAAIKASVDLLRAIDHAITQTQPGADADLKSTLDELLRATATARADADARLLELPAIATDLADSKSPIARFRQSAKQMHDFAENLVDAYRLSTAADVDADPARKSSARGQFQRAASGYCEAVLAEDQALAAAAKAWAVTPDSSRSPAEIAGQPGAADSIPGRLQTAKSHMQDEVSKARQALVAVIDGRMNAAADGGNLQAVQSLQLVKTSAASDGSVGPDCTDDQVQEAKKRYDQNVSSAAQHLAVAYRQAIAEYTKARQFIEAQAVQEEFKASEIADADGVASSDGTAPGALAVDRKLKPGMLITLNRSLPLFLTGKEFSTVDGGIQLTSVVQTKAADLLSLDFIFDVEWDRKESGDEIFVGLGEELGTEQEKHTCLQASPAADPRAGRGAVSLANKDSSGLMGFLPEPGKYLIRVEKVGYAVTFSIGTVDNGVFTPQLSRMVVDIRAFNDDLHDKATHLFIRGSRNIFTRVGLVTGPMSTSNLPAKTIAFGTFPLVQSVPGFLTGRTCDFLPEGLITRGGRLQSVSPAMLTKDFSCDIVFQNRKHATGWIGLGQTGGEDCPEKFVGVCVTADNGGHARFDFNHSDGRGKGFCTVTEPGPYVVRINKQGPAITFSIGTNEGAAFKTIGSRTIGDINAFDTDLNAGNTHLFFGGDLLYSSIALGPPMITAPQAPAAAPRQAVALPVAAPTTVPAVKLPQVTPVKNSFNGLFRIVNKQTGQYLFVEGSNKMKPGNLIGANSDKESDVQEFSLNSIQGYDGVKIVNKKSNRCLCVRINQNSPEKSDITQWAEWTANQVYAKPVANNWKLDAIGDCYRIVNEMNGQCLEQLSDGKKPVVAQPWSGNAGQLWRLEQSK